MQIDLTVEQESRLSRFAALEGKAAGELAREVFLRGLEFEATRLASPTLGTEGQQAAARIVELRKDNTLPEGVSIQDLIRQGRA